MAAVRRPTATPQRTRAEEPGVGWARLTAWMATDRGSRRAAASKEILSGSLGVVSLVYGQKFGGNMPVTPHSWVVDALL
jgi:hypothetical protein